MVKQMRPASYAHTQPIEDRRSLRPGVKPPHITVCFPGSRSSSPSARWTGDDNLKKGSLSLRAPHRMPAKPGMRTVDLCQTQYPSGSPECGRYAAPGDPLSSRPRVVWAGARSGLPLKSQDLCPHCRTPDQTDSGMNSEFGGAPPGSRA